MQKEIAVGRFDRRVVNDVETRVPSTTILDVPVSLVNMGTAVKQIIAWASADASHFVCVRDVHGIMRAQEDPKLLDIHRRADMITPDGMPLVWLSHMRGFADVDRVCGTDLVNAVTDASQANGLRHFFYGGKDGVAERMAANLKRAYPGIVVAGTLCPPFGQMSPEDDMNIVRQINAARPDIIWVGLSTPKQEFWMSDHVDHIHGAVMLGVGAAFDYVTGDIKRAPAWTHRLGLEGMFRFLQEPVRLWRRYLVLAPKFVWKVIITRKPKGGQPT